MNVIICEEAMDGLNDDAVKIVRVHPVLVQFIKNSDILEDDTFIMPLLEQNLTSTTFLAART